MNLRSVLSSLFVRNHVEAAAQRLDEIDAKQAEIQQDVDAMRCRNDALYKLVSSMRHLDEL